MTPAFVILFIACCVALFKVQNTVRLLLNSEQSAPACRQASKCATLRQAQGKLRESLMDAMRLGAKGINTNPKDGTIF